MSSELYEISQQMRNITRQITLNKSNISKKEKRVRDLRRCIDECNRSLDSVEEVNSSLEGTKNLLIAGVGQDYNISYGINGIKENRYDSRLDEAKRALNIEINQLQNEISELEQTERTLNYRHSDLKRRYDELKAKETI